jgi:hypothetical protein
MEGEPVALVRVVGSAEGTVALLRVPCVGEVVRMYGLPRRVVAVEHVPSVERPSALASLSLAGFPDPGAVVVVED